MFPQEASERLCAGGSVSRPLSLNYQLSTINSVRAGFTLLELLIVVGIIALLLVLIAPAFTTIKSGTDVTSAAYTIKGVLDTARTYAKANNTYTWVGFAGSVGPNTPPPPITGQVEVAIVASKDGTNLWSANGALPAASLYRQATGLSLRAERQWTLITESPLQQTLLTRSRFKGQRLASGFSSALGERPWSMAGALASLRLPRWESCPLTVRPWQ